MFNLFPFIALICLLAGRVLAFDGINVTVGSPTKTSRVSVANILNFPQSPATTACSANCTSANSELQACNTETACLCSNTTVASLLDCETCLFHYLIAHNEKAPNDLMGSTPVLAGYSAECSASHVPLAPAQVALQLPEDWNGPFVAVLPVGGAAITVAVGAILGTSALLLLSNM